MSTTTLIAYAAGTMEMLDVCLSALERHKSGVDNRIRIVTNAIGYAEALSVTSEHNAEVVAYEIGMTPNGSIMHGMLLDAALNDVETEYFLTLDSDCFPVADDWLLDLLRMMDDGAILAGILWPWIPPPNDIDEMTMEYRIRINHCWNNTHVACQLARKAFIVSNALRFVDGDDTGFEITERARTLGMKIDGWKPSRCALPVGEFDPEMNRHVCLIFGDKMYHQGGSTRKLQGAKIDPLGIYDAARERVFAEKGAEWILQDANSHKYLFDREEEVAQFKMRTMFDEMRRYLERNDRLFNP